MRFSTRGTLVPEGDVKKPQESVFLCQWDGEGKKPSSFFTFLKALKSCLNFSPSLFCLVFIMHATLFVCVWERECVCLCMHVCGSGNGGASLGGMKFIKVSGALWWKLCEGISTTTIAKAHAKWLAFSCFLMGILPRYFGSQGIVWL